MEEFEPYAELARLIGVGLLSGLVVTFIGHRFSISRDKKAGISGRKRELVIFMKTWRVEVDRRYLVVGGFEKRPSSFTELVSTFAGLAASVRGDMPNRETKQFDGLVSAIMSLNAGNFHTEQGHKDLLKAFDEMIAFIGK
jgi:hypothetical protein